MLRNAVSQAHTQQNSVFPFSHYLYLDEYSSNRLMYHDNWFVAPEVRPFFATAPQPHCHYSGIQAVSRGAWLAAGGYIELEGWGYEDAIQQIIWKRFTNPPVWLQGAAYHLWHS